MDFAAFAVWQLATRGLVGFGAIPLDKLHTRAFLTQVDGVYIQGS